MRNEKGSALLLAFVLSFLLMALGLGITMTSLTEFSMSDEFESHEKALFTADAGVAAAGTRLRKLNFDEVLQSVDLVPTFITSGPENIRIPISTVDARNVDFNRLPAPTGTYQANGLLTPPEGVAFGRGRFFVRLSDNDDGDNDARRDLDFKIIVTAVGVHPGPPQDLVLYNSNMKNSVAVVEAVMKRDMSLDVGSPFSVYGGSAIPSQNELFNGNSFKIDGFDHSDWTLDEIGQRSHAHAGEHTNDNAGISVLYDDGISSADSAAVDEIYDGVDPTQLDNIVGAEGAYGETPSIRDDTEFVLGRGTEDATNVVNPDFLMNFVNRVAAAADILYTTDTTLSGTGIELGAEDEPLITVAMGDLHLAGGGSGAGLLIVKGALTYTGAFDYNGLILVLGEGDAYFGGANKDIIGGIYLANILEDEAGNRYFGTPKFTVSGRSNFYFRGKSIRMAINLLPLKTISWREITREMMPPTTTGFQSVEVFDHSH